ncbi:MAG: hypothetical protein EAZ73_26245 [Oscillatoriales cyanobacterium]|nr:MAG: hypothetical protein EAZ73_26245 [Oscillatoriales cyanobacterium]
MKTTKIGFGVNNYENFRIYIEADLEPDEDCTLALDFLRTRVADEIGFPQYYLDLRSKVSDAKYDWLITFPLLTFPILALLLQAFKFLKLILAMGMMIVMMVMMVIVLSQIHLKVNIF